MKMRGVIGVVGASCAFSAALANSIISPARYGAVEVPSPSPGADDDLIEISAKSQAKEGEAILYGRDGNFEGLEKLGEEMDEAVEEVVKEALFEAVGEQMVKIEESVDSQIEQAAAELERLEKESDSNNEAVGEELKSEVAGAQAMLEMFEGKMADRMAELAGASSPPPNKDNDFLEEPDVGEANFEAEFEKFAEPAVEAYAEPFAGVPMKSAGANFLRPPKLGAHPPVPLPEHPDPFNSCIMQIEEVFNSFFVPVELEFDGKRVWYEASNEEDLGGYTGNKIVWSAGEGTWVISNIEDVTLATIEAKKWPAYTGAEDCLHDDSTVTLVANALNEVKAEPLSGRLNRTRGPYWTSCPPLAGNAGDPFEHHKSNQEVYLGTITVDEHFANRPIRSLRDCFEAWAWKVPLTVAAGFDGATGLCHGFASRDVSRDLEVVYPSRAVPMTVSCRTSCFPLRGTFMLDGETESPMNHVPFASEYTAAGCNKWVAYFQAPQGAELSTAGDHHKGSCRATGGISGMMGTDPELIDRAPIVSICFSPNWWKDGVDRKQPNGHPVYPDDVAPPA